MPAGGRNFRPPSTAMAVVEGDSRTAAAVAPMTARAAVGMGIASKAAALTLAAGKRRGAFTSVGVELVVWM